MNKTPETKVNVEMPPVSPPKKSDQMEDGKNMLGKIWMKIRDEVKQDGSIS